MSFWDRVGAAFDKVGDAAKAAGEGIGWAWTAGEDTTIGRALESAREFTSPFSRTVSAPGTAVARESVEAIDTAYSQGVARPLSTASIVMGENEDPDGFSLFGSRQIYSLDTWRDAWNRSEEISPGQAAVLNFSDQAGLGPVQGEDRFAPERAKERQEFFTNTWAGKISSGSVDLALNLGADPTYVAGRGLKALETRSITVGKGEVQGALKASQNATEGLTAREARQGSKLQRLWEVTDGKTAGEMAALPEFKTTGDAGVFGYLFERANNLHPDDVEARHALKATIYGAALGDVESIKRIKAQQGDLAEELRRLGEPPTPALAVDSFSWDDAGQGMLDLHAKVDDDLLARRDEIELEMARLDRVLASAGSTSRVAPTARESAQEALRLAKINRPSVTEGWGHLGLARRPVRFVTGNLQTRVPGFINTRDATRGYEDVTNVLGQMRYSSPETKRQLADQWAKATTDGARRNAVSAIEARMLDDYAAHYGLNRESARKFLEQAQRRRDVYLSALKSRLYSAADAPHVAFTDPEDDITHVFATPFLKTQIEDAAPITDPRVLEKALRSATNRRFIDRWGSKLIGKEKAAAAGNAVEEGVDILDEVAIMTTKAWKDLALMRGAYPLRVQMDTQGRMMSYLGAMQYMAGLKNNVGGQVRYLLTDKDGNKSPLNLLKEGDLEGSLAKQLKSKQTYKLGDTEISLDPVFDDESLERYARTIESQHGGPAALDDELALGDMRTYRATGNWGQVSPTDKGWFTAWQRAVSQQIRNSPTAMRALADQDVDSLKRWVNDTPEGRKEWLEVKDLEDSQEEWLTKVVAHVNHYMPSEDLKSVLRDADGWNLEDARKHFESKGGQADRMNVHGEAYAPNGEKAWQRRWETIRRHWYKVASDMPETIMGRSPLYAHAYRANLRESFDRLGEEGVDLVGIDKLRRQADRAARSEVARILFDASHTSNAAHALRFAMPFFAAWQDTMQKWSALIYDNPGLYTRLQQAYEAPNDLGWVVDSEGNRVDSEGNVYDAQTGQLVTDAGYRGTGQYIMLPKQLGFLTPGGSSGLKIRKDSLNAVFQGEPWWLPGWGPMVQIPANEIVRRAFPDEAEHPVLKWVLPYGVTDDSATKQLLPSWARQARNAFGGTADYADTYAMLMAQEVVKFNKGERATKPDAEEIAGKTRRWFILRAVTNNVSPVSVQPTPKFQFYIDQAHKYRNKHGLQWQEKFYEDFPQFYELSISLSANNTGIVASEEAFDASKRYRKLIRENPELGWFYVGAVDETFNPGVHTWQKTTEAGGGKNFRSKKDPSMAMREIEAERGWIEWNKFSTAIDLELERRGLTNIQQKGAEDLRLTKRLFREELGTENSAWLQQFGEREDKLQTIASAAQAAWAKDKGFAERADQVALRDYFEFRQVFREAVKQAGVSLTSDEVQAAWSAFATGLARDNLGFEQIYNRVLETDNLTRDLVYA